MSDLHDARPYWQQQAIYAAAAFVRDAMPFDVMPVRAGLPVLSPSLLNFLCLICLLPGPSGCDKRRLAKLCCSHSAGCAGRHAL